MNTNKHKNNFEKKSVLMRLIYKIVLYLKHKMWYKDFGSIIELLKKDYLLRNDGNLKGKIGVIVQDYIHRGLYNSTGCISEQLRAHYDHIDIMTDYIIESLKKDFTNIPMKQCKGELLAIIDSEYKQLVPFANDFLVKAGLASQSSLKNFEQGINKKKEETKQAIETKIAIIEKQKSAIAKKKPLYKKAWPYIAGAVVFVAALLAIVWYIVVLKERFFPKSRS